MLRTGGGYARIYAPDGSPLGTPLAEDQEGLVIADIDLDMISLAKAAADPSGHYSRPDVTQLLLNKTRREPVVVQRAPEPESSVPEAIAASVEPRLAVAA
jgi:aliphatic nitrilase